MIQLLLVSESRHPLSPTGGLDGGDAMVEVDLTNELNVSSKKIISGTAEGDGCCSTSSIELHRERGTRNIRIHGEVCITGIE